jgi:hypothetical protein
MLPIYICLKNLWTERTIIRTNDKLPYIVPWSLVVSETREIVSPVQNACDTVRDKNCELSRAIDIAAKQLIQATSDNNQHLLMILKGTIEAAINGGIIVYQKVQLYTDVKILIFRHFSHLIMFQNFPLK